MLLATGGPQVRLGGWLFLVGCPDGLASGSLVGRNSLDLARDTVERCPQAEVFAQALEHSLRAQLLDQALVFARVGGALLAHERFDLSIRDRQVELVGDRLEDELACDRLLRLAAE